MYPGPNFLSSFKPSNITSTTYSASGTGSTSRRGDYTSYSSPTMAGGSYGPNYGSTARYRKTPYKKYAKKTKFATVAQVEKLIQQSTVLKRFTTSISDTTVDIGGVVTNICVVPEGDGEGERNGRYIKVISSSVRGQLKNTAAAPSVLARIVLANWKQANKTAPNVTNYFENTAYPVNSYRQRDYTKKLVFLFDKTFTLNPASDVFVNVSKFININKNFKTPIVINYDETGTGAYNTQLEDTLYLAIFPSVDEGLYAVLENVIYYHD